MLGFVWAGLATDSSSCHSLGMASYGDPLAGELPHGGICPATEISCTTCPAATRIKCPQGLCAADVSECTPNVFIRGVQALLPP
eukprot:CAMPEP_0181176586 /NCGR_PEP_ID=MMETSP1096-20121128/4708_1 /TAXON_ID=156174 ORGANISM="Chrysochromulina ericina, Strain CCMP281" /NCGR_SAMPLE_ID=MMETSP1096 /ASSEMBLY_ACC=CAM_ASM_000453 /LENGTH=83 /DNA_ID=CAMNT_0023264683 /DNA_START=12 /DNA_END=263 /DNA_ORIENTATION=+